ncbi:hypothetical protein ACHAXT_004252 [Thalassiosira profunda]
MAAAVPQECEDALRRIEENDPALKEVRLVYEPVGFAVATNEAEGSVVVYFSAGISPSANFFARLGDAVGNNTQLNILDFSGLQGAVPGVAGNTAFLDGIRRNSSITTLCLQGVDLSDVGICAVLNCLGGESSNLCDSFTSVQLFRSRSGNDAGVDAFKSTIRRCTNLRTLKFLRSGDDSVRFHEILEAVNDPRQLEELKTPPIGRAGVDALVPLLQNVESKLRRLQLHVVGDDIDVGTLATVLGKSDSLKNFDLRLPTGWHGAGVQSSEVAQFWRSFRSVLCDKSTINGTYFSNHTLTYASLFGNGRLVPIEVTDILEMNLYIENKKHLAMLKVLRYHRHIDMTPFLEWDLKFLPQAIDWLEMFRTLQNRHLGGRVEISVPDAIIGRIKLDAIYQFVRGSPEVFEAPALASGGKRKRGDS